LTNPVPLVGKASEWPGATALHAVLARRPVVAIRPKHFFRDDENGGAMPKSVTIAFEPPPALAHLSCEEYGHLIGDAVASAETEAAARRGEAGTSVLGRQRIMAQQWNERPANAEPRREPSPTVACRDKWRRIERLQQNKLFQQLYRAAFQSFRTGLAALFPVGTWSMRFRASILVSTA
jgi:hypothetical protein